MVEGMPKQDEFIKYGPYGSQSPPTFNFFLEDTDKIKTVNVGAGYIVDGIGFEIVDKNNSIKTVWFGGDGGNQNKISLKDNEHITQISGFEGDFAWCSYNRFVVQIRVHTNLVPDGYGPYGTMKDCKNVESFKAPDPITGSIAGFFGIRESYLQSIGIYVQKPIVSYGPYGSQETNTFNVSFEKNDKVSTVTIGSGYIVDGIGFDIVDQSGKTKSIYHGSEGHESTTINLTSNEYITQISGFEGDYADLGGRRHVVQIKIHTNLAPNGYGPYGRLLNCTNVKSFSSPGPSAGAIVGFFGRIGTYLESIGVSMKKD